MLSLMSSLRLNLRGHIDTLLLVQTGGASGVRGVGCREQSALFRRFRRAGIGRRLEGSGGISTAEVERPFTGHGFATSILREHSLIEVA